ncbi:galactose oxidase [Rhizophagus irregularis]|uniref:Galactose oxidase n=1 Tax=Rhizophagus irregularis TaxID=588596 RepID=A0A2N0QBY1_9GLOM|nr:galactose oxidase [Rhizophagus irregularis]
MGCKFLNHHLMLVLLIQLFLLITLFVNGQFIPGPRTSHTATLVGDKIYFIGGYNFSITLKESDIFYYDGNKLAWVEVNNQVSGQGADMRFRYGHTANIGGPKQDLIFIIGYVPLSLVYQLDTKTNNVTTPMILGDVPTNDYSVAMSSVTYQGKIYLFGGFDDINNIVYNQHIIFDTISLSWIDGSNVNGPPPRYKHTATLVDKFIYYIGGMETNIYASMSSIYRYNIISNTWSLEVATLASGNTPGRRAGHSAVLVEGKICIFGGAYFDSSPTESIAMLDTNTLEWSIPHFKNPKRQNMPTLPNLVFHTATLVDKRMLVAFGNDTDIVVNGYKGLNNNFYIFDFNNNEWYIATADELTNPSSNIPKLFSSNSAGISSNRSAIIGLSVGIPLVVLAIVGILIFVYYRRKKNQSKGNWNWSLFSKKRSSSPPPPSTDPHSQGSEAHLPPPPSTDSHSQGSEAPPLPSPPLTDPRSQGSKALLPPPPPPKTP